MCQHFDPPVSEVGKVRDGSGTTPLFDQFADRHVNAAFVLPNELALIPEFRAVGGRVWSNFLIQVMAARIVETNIRSD
jgi:hypothetical protein